MLSIRKPYLLFMGEETDRVYAKTGLGIAQWDAENCVGQLRLTPDTVDLGLPDLTVEAALGHGAKTLVLGVVVIGGAIPPATLTVLRHALECGLDVAAGMHQRLADIPELRRVAEKSGARIIDVRVPPPNIPVGTGAKRVGKRLITMGTDCALGKKYTALALAQEMLVHGFDVDFRASGQTGILISGAGIPIDAVVADFVSGAGEMLSPAADSPDHWDVVEGQGSLFHPGYAAVTAGLLTGSQPDAFVVCTDATREHMAGWPDFPLPSIGEVVELTVMMARRVNPAVRCLGISVNTSSLPESERLPYLEGLTAEWGLPAVDPLHGGVGPLVESLKSW
jgi:uncharacterized NAD-dependent epimerase/dehydratase family protein